MKYWLYCLIHEVYNLRLILFQNKDTLTAADAISNIIQRIEHWCDNTFKIRSFS